MKKNFKIDQLIALENESGYYDLHNCYMLSSIIVDYSKRNISISFTKINPIDHKWVNESDPNLLIISFSNIHHFSSSTNFMTENENLSIEEVAYKEPEDFNISYFIPEELSKPDHHLLFLLENGNHIRIYAEEGSLITSSLQVPSA